MKNINQIFKYGLLAMSSLVIFSCDSDDDAPYAVGNSLALLEETIISSVDETLMVNISEFSITTPITSIEIFQGDDKLGDVTLTGDLEGTYNSNFFLPFDGSGSKDFTFVSTESNGEVGKTEVSLEVVEPLSLTNEVISIEYGKITGGDTDTIIEYEISDSGSVLDEIKLYWKNGVNGTYVEDTSVTLSLSGDTVDLKELAYVDYGLEEEDELYYKFEALSSGVIISEVETSVLLTEVIN